MSSSFKRKDIEPFKFKRKHLCAGEGVGSSVSAFLEGATVYEVEYCAYSELRRPIKNQSSAAGKFEVMVNRGRTGVSYSLPTTGT